MSELMKRILKDKLETRKVLARLPIEQKLILMERMRDRSRLLASNPLRTKYAVTPEVSVSGDGVELPVPDVQKTGSTSPVDHQLPDQSNILPNSVTLFATLLKQPGRWQTTQKTEHEPEPESP